MERFDNLYSVGRNGMHRYNNQDHSMLTAMLAARNLMGESHDVWDVNVERSYHEEFVAKPIAGEAGAGEAADAPFGGERDDLPGTGSAPLTPVARAVGPDGVLDAIAATPAPEAAGRRERADTDEPSGTSAAAAASGRIGKGAVRTLREPA